MMKVDVKVSGNMIDGRQGWAYVCNSGNVVVLKADMDAPQEYDDYKTFGQLKVGFNHRGHESFGYGHLEVEKGKWSIGGWGCGIHADFGFSDMMELIDGAGLPKVRQDDIVAVALYTKELRAATLSLFKVGRVDINCMTIARLIPLTDEEMKEVAQDVNRWVNR